MAKKEDSERSDLYMCYVCLEDQTERIPRLLSCHHSFCEHCITKLVKSGKIECPTCRHVTSVEENDVTKLSMNFMLLKIKDHIEKVASNKNSVCQMCKTNTADKRCKDCTHLLCVDCIEKHNKFKGFKDHQILSVCPNHEEGVITHVCVQCLKQVCSLCIFNDHSSHTDDVVPFDEGIKDIKARINVLQSEVERKLVSLKRTKKKHEEKWVEAKKQQSEVEVLYNSYARKTREILEVLEKLRANTEEVNKILFTCECDRDRICKLGSLLRNTSMEEDLNILHKYCDIKRNREKDLELTCNQSFKLMEVPDKIWERIDEGPTVFWQRAKLYYKTTQMSTLGIKRPTRIQRMKPDMAVIIDVSMGVVVSISNTGALQSAGFLPHSAKREDIQFFQEKKDVTTNKMFLFVQQQNRLMRYNYPGCTDVEVFKPNIKTLTRFCVLDKKLLVLFDGSLKRLYKYSTDNNEAKRMDNGFEVDDFTVLPSSGIYVITDSNTNKLILHDGNSIIAHDKNKFFCRPTICTTCPFGILVAHKGGDCIKLVTYQDEVFEYHSVKEEEGVKAVVSMEYDYPYLWIAEDDSQGYCCIKCYLFSSMLDFDLIRQTHQ